MKTYLAGRMLSKDIAEALVLPHAAALCDAAAKPGAATQVLVDTFLLLRMFLVDYKEQSPDVNEALSRLFDATPVGTMPDVDLGFAAMAALTGCRGTYAGAVQKMIAAVDAWGRYQDPSRPNHAWIVGNALAMLGSGAGPLSDVASPATIDTLFDVGLPACVSLMRYVALTGGLPAVNPADYPLVDVTWLHREFHVGGRMMVPMVSLLGFVKKLHGTDPARVCARVTSELAAGKPPTTPEVFLTDVTRVFVDRKFFPTWASAFLLLLQKQFAEVD